MESREQNSCCSQLSALEHNRTTSPRVLCASYDSSMFGHVTVSVSLFICAAAPRCKPTISPLNSPARFFLRLSPLGSHTRASLLPCQPVSGSLPAPGASPPQASPFTAAAPVLSARVGCVLLGLAGQHGPRGSASLRCLTSAERERALDRDEPQTITLSSSWMWAPGCWQNER